MTALDPTPTPSREERYEHLDHELNALLFSINALDNFVSEADNDEWPLDRLADWLQQGRDYAAQLKTVLGALERLVGDRMSEYRQTIEGVGTLERHRNKSRTNWHKGDLLHAVLDTVLVDKDTGEIVAETPLDKVLAVWNLPSPRTTVLRDRGIDPDEFCDVTDNGGFTVSIR